MLLFDRQRSDHRTTFHLHPLDWRLGLFVTKLGDLDFGARPPGLRLGVQALPLEVHFDWLPETWWELLLTPRMRSILRKLRRKQPVQADKPDASGTVRF